MNVEVGAMSSQMAGSMGGDNKPLPTINTRTHGGCGYRNVEVVLYDMQITAGLRRARATAICVPIIRGRMNQMAKHTLWASHNGGWFAMYFRVVWRVNSTHSCHSVVTETNTNSINPKYGMI